ncbi:hypothetical protein ACFQX6_18040 [Streptosporangium lutulentum]
MSETTPESGDLGPRVAFHRERLGLTREELDKRTGIPRGRSTTSRRIPSA